MLLHPLEQRVRQPRVLYLTATYSRYQIRFYNAFERQRDGAFERSELDYCSEVEDLCLRYNVSFAPDPRHQWRFGGGVTHHNLQPGGFHIHSRFRGRNAPRHHARAPQHHRLGGLCVRRGRVTAFAKTHG